MKSVALVSNHPAALSFVAEAIAEETGTPATGQASYAFTDPSEGRFLIYEVAPRYLTMETNEPTAAQIGLTDEIGDLTVMLIECRSRRLIADTLRTVSRRLELPLVVVDDEDNVIPAHQITHDGFVL